MLLSVLGSPPDASTGAAEHGVVPKSLRVEVVSNRLVSGLDFIEKVAMDADA